MCQKQRVYYPLSEERELLMDSLLGKAVKEQNKPRVINEQAPRFFMPGEDTLYGKKLVLRGLKKKLGREKKGLRTEVRQETEQLLSQRKQQKTNRVKEDRQRTKEFRSKIVKELK